MIHASFFDHFKIHMHQLLGKVLHVVVVITGVHSKPTQT